MRDGFKPGELFVYTNGNSWQLGVVKSQRDEHTYFCFYHTGDTAAATPVTHMHKLENALFPPIRHYIEARTGHEYTI